MPLPSTTTVTSGRSTCKEGPPNAARISALQEQARGPNTCPDAAPERRPEDAAWKAPRADGPPVRPHPSCDTAARGGVDARAGQPRTGWHPSYNGDPRGSRRPMSDQSSGCHFLHRLNSAAGQAQTDSSPSAFQEATRRLSCHPTRFATRRKYHGGVGKRAPFIKL